MVLLPASSSPSVTVPGISQETGVLERASSGEDPEPDWARSEPSVTLVAATDAERLDGTQLPKFKTVSPLRPSSTYPMLPSLNSGPWPLAPPAPTPYPTATMDDDSWNTLELQSGALFHFLPPVVHKVQDRKFLEKVHYIYVLQTKTELPQYFRSRMTVERRYSDFLWFRRVLALENPGVIVPSLPAKHFPLEKVVDVDVSTTLTLRCRQLHRFLESLGSHPVVQQSATFQAFLELPAHQWATWRKYKNEVCVRRGPSLWENFLQELAQFVRSIQASVGPRQMQYVGDLQDDWRAANKLQLEHHTRHLRNFQDNLRDLRRKLLPWAQRAAEMMATHLELPKLLSHMAQVERRGGDSELAAILKNLTADLNVASTIGDPGRYEFDAEVQEVADILDWTTTEISAALDCIEADMQQRRDLEDLQLALAHKKERLVLTVGPAVEVARKSLVADVQLMQHRQEWAEGQLQKTDEILLNEVQRLYKTLSGHLLELCSLVQKLLARNQEYIYGRLNATDYLGD